MFKRSLKRVSLVCLVVLISGAVALAALTAVFCIPAREMHMNVRKSLDTFREEGEYPRYISGYINTRLDNFADALMINTAIFSEPHNTPLQKAIHAYHREIQGGDSSKKTVALISLIENGNANTELADYSRYWHGYVVLLRPFLYFFNYDDLRVVISMIQIALMAVVMYLLCKRNQAWLLVPFVGYILTISPTGTVFCLEFFFDHAITMLACCLLLLFETRMNDAACEWFFLFIGMAISFFDLLTFPAVSFGVPFCLLFCLRQKASLKTSVLFFIRCGVMWCAGYLGFWASKWLYGTLLSDSSVLTAAIEALLFRTSNHTLTNPYISRVDAIRNCLAIFNKKPLYCRIAALILLIGILRRALSKELTFLAQPSTLLFLMIAVIPFAWWMSAANHAYSHAWFEHRHFSITVFSVLAWLFNKKPSGDAAGV